MADLVHELITQSAARSPKAEALCYQTQRLDYERLAAQVERAAQGLLGLGMRANDRVAVYLEKRIETVLTLFAISAAGGVFVPVNPLLKPEQVAYILQDCNVNILVTSAERHPALASALSNCPDLQKVVMVGQHSNWTGDTNYACSSWAALIANELQILPHRRIDADVAAILYTSGSTGRPKGVVLSHRNLLAGAASVVQYLENTAQDRLLAVLPLSFDYGLSQLMTAFQVGATVVLLNYLMPRDIVNAVIDEKITGLAAVPPLWIQLSQLTWPAQTSLRYLTNSGGVMPQVTTENLRQRFSDSKLYLMYGLTEAFRSTFLPPEQIDRRPGSIGKAIPNAEILVLRADGSECDADEPGELVHRGALVAMGYWNDQDKTKERFRPLPAREGLPTQEIAVWSGDTVVRDKEGYLYFVGRTDDMIKVSGYRISPSEIEEVASRFDGVREVAVMGVPHPLLGQAIVMVISAQFTAIELDGLRQYCQKQLPAYMLPAHIELVADELPRNPNGKLDRSLFKARFANIFKK